MDIKNSTVKKHIVLIGMPGVGKSTIGVVLAKETGRAFIDTDLLIQNREKRLLSEIISEEGVEGFLKIEDDVCSHVESDAAAVIATGGSVVYGENAMRHLKEVGTVVYLRLSLKNLTERLGDLAMRGVVLRPGQTLGTLYDERTPLYERYADIIVDEDGSNLEGTLRKVRHTLNEKTMTV